MLVCPLGLTLVAQIFQKVACFWSSPNFYPNLPIFLHGYIRHIRDIFQLCLVVGPHIEEVADALAAHQDRLRVLVCTPARALLHKIHPFFYLVKSLLLLLNLSKRSLHWSSAEFSSLLIHLGILAPASALTFNSGLTSSEACPSPNGRRSKSRRRTILAEDPLFVHFVSSSRLCTAHTPTW